MPNTIPEGLIPNEINWRLQQFYYEHCIGNSDPTYREAIITLGQDINVGILPGNEYELEYVLSVIDNHPLGNTTAWTTMRGYLTA